ncbi:carboxylesterase/lipase family protein [Agromyces atrinae]|uniref:Carboxylic ester hydrolase n=1 Tax=Agromyces atrinae TaxID=592376 RepID=A0A4Q2M9N2_9MICO|nr:carboxylesterase family protein [Agromyces atrinae]NYD66285.1 para-nitrobenzyl esterase [Agromyces atrinae]RXZ86612.1 carboxylesterase/lipase family protein [Agromyces atrinae]
MAAETAARRIDLPAGTIEGRAADGVAVFRGVPYAAAPFGENRFRAPQPVEPWDGIRDATVFGATSPQTPYPGPLGAILPTSEIAGTDILNLAVWAPDEDPAGSHPVFVWIHGGGLTRGANSLDAYDGSRFAEQGVVVVAVNYRLGAEGFSVLDDAPRNLGLADLRAALEWVRENIAAFGGDPADVTVGGQSAGGALTAALLAMPDAETLFARTIVQSGPLDAQPESEARRVTDAMAKHLGIAATREAFAAVTPERLLEAQEHVLAGGSPLTSGPSFTLTIGGELVPENPRDALRSGVSANLPLLIGTTTEEYRLWFVPTGRLRKISKLMLLGARVAKRMPSSLVATFRDARPGARPGEILGAIVTELILRAPAQDVADGRLTEGAATWIFEFAWRSPVESADGDVLGAAHAVEIPFVFDNAETTDAAPLVGEAPPRSLARSMHASWLTFIRSGRADWTEWDATRPVRVFDGADDPIALAPRDDERRALLEWEAGRRAASGTSRGAAEVPA